jgi:pyridoxine 5-phosphate synthase
MTKLSVNINKIAVIRNSRGGNVPDVLKVALDCERFGAQGITVHPRPDERHIRYADVRALKSLVTTEFNIEGYPNSSFIDLVKEVKPHQVTLVPDPPDALTSNAGWDTIANQSLLSDIVAEFKPLGIRVSVFVGTDLNHIEYAKKLGADRVELYTEPYAETFLTNKELAVKDFVLAGKYAKKIGLGLNAGHDLSLVNLKYLIECIPEIDEVSIGHALIADALYYGLENTIQMYLQQLSI